MNYEDPESLEACRMQYLQGYVAGMFVFLLLWFTRYFFRAGGLNSKPVGYAVLAGLIVTALIFIYYQVRLAMVNNWITRNPDIGEAVNNELYRHCAQRAWKPAFIGAIVTTMILALVSFGYPVVDLIFVSLSNIVVGSFVYLFALYLYWRTA